jgi:hypothetical protein
MCTHHSCYLVTLDVKPLQYYDPVIMTSVQHAAGATGKKNPKQARGLNVRLPVTKSRDVTGNRRSEPQRCYEILKPWLDLANGETIGPVFRVAKREFNLVDPFYESLRGSVKAWLEYLCQPELRSHVKSWFQRLEQEVKDPVQRSHVPRPAIHVPPWKAEGGEFWGEFVIEAGRLRDNPANLRDVFKLALCGAEIDRLRQCGICRHFFYAIPIDRKTCSEKCNTRRRVRAWRGVEDSRERRAWVLHQGGKDVVQIASVLRVKPKKVRWYLSRARKERP